MSIPSTDTVLATYQETIQRQERNIENLITERDWARGRIDVLEAEDEVSTSIIQDLERQLEQANITSDDLSNLAHHALGLSDAVRGVTAHLVESLEIEVDEDGDVLAVHNTRAS